MIPALIQLGIVALILALCVRVVWRATAIPPELLRGPRCGSCAYELGGVRDRCPECGADLREAGINTPLDLVHKRGSTASAALAWLLVALLLTMCAEGVALQLRGPPAKNAFTRIRTSVVLMPESSTFESSTTQSEDYSVTIETDVATGRGGSVRQGTISVTVSVPPARVTAEVDPTSMTCTIDGQRLPFDARAVERIFGSAGLDPERESTASEIRTIATMIHASKRNPRDYFSRPAGNANLVRLIANSSSTAMPEPIDIIARSIQATGLLVWIVGLIVIIRMRRKILARVKTRYAAASP
jgi:hypothetical protein